MTWIDSYASGWLDWIRDQAGADTDTRTLLMLDGAFLPGLHRRLAPGGPDQRICRALFKGLPGCNDAVLAVSPIVVEYHANDVVLHDVLTMTDGRPMVTLIKTIETVQQLAARLAQWCVVDADGSFFNFRFPDTRRLPAIARTLTATQRAQMLGPARAWYCINRFGRWEPLPISVGAVASDAPPRLTAEQFTTLAGDSEADEILALLAPDFDDTTRDALPSKRYQQARQALEAADRHGIRDIQDRIARVATALRPTT